MSGKRRETGEVGSFNSAAIRRWYIGQGDSWTGPYTDLEVIRRIQDGVLSWADFIWNPAGGMKWNRISAMDAFQAYMPKAPADDLIRDILNTIEKKMSPGSTPGSEASSLSRRRSVWFLQFEGSEFGPLTLAEVQVILRSGKLKGRLYAWREGMANWVPVEQAEELHEITQVADLPAKSSSDERRRSKRVPLVATVRFNIPGDTSAGSNKYMGVCRDISASGLLILSNRVPQEALAGMRMEISPLGSSGVEPFSADVEVIRVMPDKKGFSVRFTKMTEAARIAIDKYLARN